MKLLFVGLVLVISLSGCIVPTSWTISSEKQEAARSSALQSVESFRRYVKDESSDVAVKAVELTVQVNLALACVITGESLEDIIAIFETIKKEKADANAKLIEPVPVAPVIIPEVKKEVEESVKPESK